MTAHDQRIINARLKAERLKVRAYLVAPNVWRVKCSGSCEKHRGTKAGTFSWHFIRQVFQKLVCDCDGSAWGAACYHVGAVERKLIRQEYRKLSPEERAIFRQTLAGFQVKAA